MNHTCMRVCRQEQWRKHEPHMHESVQARAMEKTEVDPDKLNFSWTFLKFGWRSSVDPTTAIFFKKSSAWT